MQSPKVLFAIATAGLLFALVAFALFLTTSLPSGVAVGLTGVGWGLAIYGTVMGVIRLREQRGEGQR